MSTTDLPPVHFVIGTGRCGSSLLHELLCHHPRVGFMSNVDDRLPGAWRTSGVNGSLHRSLPHALTRKGRIRFAPSEGYRALDREVSRQLAWSRRDLDEADATPWLRDRLRQFVGRRAARQPGTVFVHKLTGWPRVGLLRAVFPEARFVHVVRDGRAVANSWVKQPWWLGHEGPGRWQWGDLSPEHDELWSAHGRTAPVLAGIGWMLLLDAWHRQRDRLPDDAWAEVRFEDLVDSPHAVADDLTAFLGLGEDATLTATLDEYPFEPGRRTGWRRDLGDQQSQSLTSLLADHLAAYGYEVTA